MAENNTWSLSTSSPSHSGTGVAEFANYNTSWHDTNQGVTINGNSGTVAMVTDNVTTSTGDIFTGCLNSKLVCFHYEDITQMTGVREIFLIVYVIVAIFAFFGNFLIIWSIVRHRNMRTVTNIYILNLAVSDAGIGLLVMPFKFFEYGSLHTWSLIQTDVMCQIFSFILPVLIFSSVLTLIAISIERYFVIVHPFSTRRIQILGRTMKIIVAIWLISCIFAVPYPIYAKVNKVRLWSQYGFVEPAMCEDGFESIDAMLGYDKNHPARFRRIFFTILFVIFYMLPIMIIGFTTYTIVCALVRVPSVGERHLQTTHTENNKKKVAKMIMIVAIIFFVSWTPKYIVNMMSQYQKNSFLKERNFLFTMLTMHLIGFLNSALNPVIYVAMSHLFRNSCKSIVMKLVCCKNQSFNVSSDTGSDRRNTGSSGRPAFRSRNMADTPMTRQVTLSSTKKQNGSGLNGFMLPQTRKKSSSSTKKFSALENSDDANKKAYKNMARKLSYAGLANDTSLPRQVLRKLSQSKITGTPKLSDEERQNWRGSMNCLLEIQLSENEDMEVRNKNFDGDQHLDTLADTNIEEIHLDGLDAENEKMFIGKINRGRSLCSVLEKLSRGKMSESLISDTLIEEEEEELESEDGCGYSVSFSNLEDKTKEKDVIKTSRNNKVMSVMDHVAVNEHPIGRKANFEEADYVPDAISGLRDNDTVNCAILDGDLLKEETDMTTVKAFKRSKGKVHPVVETPYVRHCNGYTIVNERGQPILVEKDRVEIKIDNGIADKAFYMRGQPQSGPYKYKTTQITPLGIESHNQMLKKQQAMIHNNKQPCVTIPSDIYTPEGKINKSQTSAFQAVEHSNLGKHSFKLQPDTLDDILHEVEISKSNQSCLQHFDLHVIDKDVPFLGGRQRKNGVVDSGTVLPLIA